VKQLNKSDNQFGSLDPEKVYFVEKFGYLIKKINGGYGSPVQNALFDRINSAVSDFKTDLPNIVHNLKIKRLKSLTNRNVKQVEAKEQELDSKSKVSIKTDEITKKISDKINKIEKTIAEKAKTDTQKTADESQVKQTVIEKEIDIFVDDIVLEKQSSIIKKKTSSTLKPSIATIREEKRLELIKAKPYKKESLNTVTISKKPIVKSKPIPMKELTEWERKWHKYDGDIISEGFNGYS
jgi:hypothetical protein